MRSLGRAFALAIRSRCRPSLGKLVRSSLGCASPRAGRLASLRVGRLWSRPPCRTVALIALCVISCIGPGQKGAPLERDRLAGPAPWTDAPLADSPGDFRFAIVTDRTGEHRDAVFESAIEKLNLLRPAFVLSVGDLIEGYTEDSAELATQWDGFQGMVRRLTVPFFYAPGNHDYSNSRMAEVWRERFGPSFYRFRYRDVLFVVLNSELFSSVSNPGHPVEGPDTQAAQMEFVRRALSQEPQARFTFVLLHQPLWDRENPPADWLEVESLLGDRPYAVFAGHIHAYTKQVRHDRRYITLATTGGRSQLRGLDRGEFDEVALVSMTPSGPVIANLLLDGIQNEDVRTEATRAVVGRLDHAISQSTDRVPERGFRTGEVRFTVRNDGRVPLALEGRFEAGPDLAPKPERVSVRVAPGAVQSVPVQLRAARSLDLASAAPARAHWTLTSEEPEGAVSVDLESWLLPEARFECPRAARKVVVDGDLSEWPPLRFAAQGRPSQDSDAAGPAGGGFHFGVSYDDRYVYVAVAASDSTPWSDPARSERDQDAVSVLLDARPDPARSTNEGFFRAIASGSMKQMMWAWLTPVEAQPDPIFRSMLPALPDGTRRAVKRTSKGYTAELAIPASFLDERQGKPWQTFRLEVGQRDVDADGQSQVQHVWRPSRFGTGSALPIPGSGTFVRAGKPDAAH